MKTIDKIVTAIGFALLFGGVTTTLHAGINKDPIEFVGGVVISGIGMRYALKRANDYKADYQI